MSTKSAIVIICLGSMGIVLTGYGLSRPPKLPPPCVETLYEVQQVNTYSCAPGARAEKLDEHVIVCRCPAQKVESSDDATK